MAHKNLVGGTSYDTKSGRTLVNGTGYSIKKGRTLVDGTGYDISFAPAVLIDFTVEGIAYQAEDGMTWGEWIASPYNTDGFFIDDEYKGLVATADWMYVSLPGSYSEVYPGDTIIANMAYTTW